MLIRPEGSRPRREPTGPWRLLGVCALVGFVSAACGPSGPTKATVRIEPASLTIAAGAVEQTFTATVTGGDAVTWTLAGVGRISPVTGSKTSYEPPASVPASQTATLTATTGGASASATVTVTPVSATAGNLSVYLDGLVEPGARGAVTVDGPDGFTASLSSSRTLLDLAPGSYVVTGTAVRVRRGNLDAVSRPSVICSPPAAVASACPVTVVAGETARVHAVYEVDETTGRLYVPGYDQGAVAAYAADRLGATNSEPPTLLLGGTPSAQGVAFDASGDLWVTDWDHNAIREYAASQLAASGSPEPRVTLTFGGLANPTALAFDASGALWVTNRGNATIVRYDAAQLGASGSPTPAAVIADDGGGLLNGPTGIAFDAAGRLWVANAFSRTLFRYDDPSGLTGTVTDPPDAVVASSGFVGPQGPAFAADGALWVGDETTIVKFAPEQLQASGTVTPAVILAGQGGVGGVAFDAAGDLWATDAGGRLFALTPDQLAESGSPAPTVVLTGFPGVNLGLLAFYPPPAGSPLAQPALGPFP